MNPEGVQLPGNITGARERAQELTGVAGQYKAAEPTISDVLREKVTRLFADNQDIVKPLDEATAGYLSAPAEGREKFQDIFNPFQREKLVSQYIGNEALPMLSLSNIYGNRLGRIDDVIGAGTRAFQAATAAKIAEAEQANQTYSNLLSEYQIAQNVAAAQAAANRRDTQVVEANGRKYLVDTQTGDIIQDLGTSSTGSGGGGGGGLESILASILTGNMGGGNRYIVTPVQQPSVRIKDTGPSARISEDDRPSVRILD